MKLYQITTQCGAKIQTAKLTEAEKTTYPITQYPVICPLCKHSHGSEMCSIREVEVEIP